MAGNLILDQISTHDNPGQVASAPCGSYTTDVHTFRQLLFDLFQPLLHHINGLALGQQVKAGNKLVTFIQHSKLGSY
ncbi:hypothetical protein ES703_90002 [subsurface metagenome]